MDAKRSPRGSKEAWALLEAGPGAPRPSKAATGSASVAIRPCS